MFKLFSISFERDLEAARKNVSKIWASVPLWTSRALQCTVWVRDQVVVWCVSRSGCRLLIVSTVIALRSRLFNNSPLRRPNGEPLKPYIGLFWNLENPKIGPYKSDWSQQRSSSVEPDRTEQKRSKWLDALNFEVDLKRSSMFHTHAGRQLWSSNLEAACTMVRDSR